TIAETPFATFAGSLAAVYDPGSFKLYNPVLAAEHTFIEKTLKATLNLGWTRIDPNGGESISDLQPAIGVTLSPDHHHFWSFAADYTFDNDVDGEDTGSISVTRTVARFGSKIKLSVEKHQVIGLSLTRFF
ncbi:MAG TPA: hypothetical protein VHK90_01360, partial [Thermoanaerobaculia bacterium]|nr:hypothetical protein [Thermoanaerobaculia bacterium]